MDTQKIEQLSIPIHAIHFDYSVSIDVNNPLQFSNVLILYTLTQII